MKSKKAKVENHSDEVVPTNIDSNSATSQKSASTVEEVLLPSSAEAATEIVFLGDCNLQAQPLLLPIILLKKRSKIHSAVVALGGSLICLICRYLIGWVNKTTNM